MTDRLADAFDDGRSETADQRADRNWTEVLQELRVLQTGTQILTGFLLALAFQPAFANLSVGQRTLYLVLVVLAGVSAIVALAPVALHRGVFRLRTKPAVVEYGHAAIVVALTAVAALLVGVVAFVFDVVVADAAATVVAVVLGALIVGMWVVAPAVVRARKRRSGR